ncbi:MAG: murein biosynthesis integral membrane protein MurJ [Hyphomonadaceae bacterium]|nr:murein biosynthesis integral membrane protein MurJ [Hyphomonadaceae bacterium]
MSLARNVIVQTTFTLGSRVLGFARDLALNARFGGQSPLMDAWTKALWLPNLFRRLFAEGAFAQGFVPVFAKTLKIEGQAEAEKVASQALAFIMVVVVVFSILLELVMPWLMPVILYTYVDDPEIMKIAVLMTQLTTPYLACMTLTSLLSGVLNTREKFALSSAAPILLNVVTLLPLLVVQDRTMAAYWAAAAVTVAGLLQGALLWWGVRRMGIKVSIGLPALTSSVKRVLALAIPGAIAGGGVQINSAVSNVLTGTDAGASGVLYNAERLYQLPIGLIGVAVGMALVPRLSRYFADTDHASADKAMDDGIVLSMAFTLPAALALLIMPYFIIDGVMRQGAFTLDDSRRIAEVLRQFSWGVPAFVLAKVFTPPFFARQRSKQPAMFTGITVGLNIVLGAALWFGLPKFVDGMDGAIGLAIATSVCGWINVFLLAGTLAREKVYRVSAAAWGRLARLGLACAAMGAFIAVCAWEYPLLSQILLRKEIAAVVVSSVGFAIFLGCAVLFRAVTVAEIRSSLRREKGAPGVVLPGGGEG